MGRFKRCTAPVPLLHLWIIDRHDAGFGIVGCRFVAYGEEKHRAKNKDEWGTGIVEGIVTGSASNAVSGPSMIPLLALGIPVHNCSRFDWHVLSAKPGPTIFATEPPLFMGGQLIARVSLSLASLPLASGSRPTRLSVISPPHGWKIIAYLPTQYLYPFIFMTALAASYSSRASIWDVGFHCYLV